MLPAKELARSTQLQQDGDLAAGRGGGAGKKAATLSFSGT